MSNNHDAPPGDTVQVKGTGVQGGGTQSLEGGYTLKLGTDKIIGNGSFVSPPGRRPPAGPARRRCPLLCAPRPPASLAPPRRRRRPLLRARSRAEPAAARPLARGGRAGHSAE